MVELHRVCEYGRQAVTYESLVCSLCALTSPSSPVLIPFQLCILAESVFWQAKENQYLYSVLWPGIIQDSILQIFVPLNPRTKLMCGAMFPLFALQSGVCLQIAMPSSTANVGTRSLGVLSSSAQAGQPPTMGDTTVEVEDGVMSQPPIRATSIPVAPTTSSHTLHPYPTSDIEGQVPMFLDGVAMATENETRAESSSQEGHVRPGRVPVSRESIPGSCPPPCPRPTGSLVMRTFHDPTS